MEKKKIIGYLKITFFSFLLTFGFLFTTQKTYANNYINFNFDICNILPFLPQCQEEEEEEENVYICHKTQSEENPWVEIEVDENAVDTHLEHGDFLIDE